MKEHLFQTLSPKIADNVALREPQRAAYAKIAEHYAGTDAEREVGLVLPVGCGKSGLIAVAPFAVGATRALVIAPGIRIAKQLLEKDFDPESPEMFYKKCGVLRGEPWPEVAEIRSTSSNVGDLQDADVVVTNIQQLQGQDNRWLNVLPQDFFDLILVDEGHHNVASSWAQLRQHFPDAKIVNVSATPARADGRLMAGKIIYSFPVVRAIEQGFVKRLKAVVLNPASLRFVRIEDGIEVEVSRSEVQRLGESDADFRRSIVSSKETLDTIVQCSIEQLKKLRSETGENRHKIIASALNYRHCTQIVEAYQARGMQAAFIHSKEDGVANDRILAKLDNHELDVIVQVRMLGEGFDHPYLSVAAICSIFANLSPFVQFVGRIMRAVDKGDPQSRNNQGVVVFHAGANVAGRWSDFKEFSGADQTYFDDLLPTEEVLDFSTEDSIEIEPDTTRIISTSSLEIVSQAEILLEEDALVELDDEQRRALEKLVDQVGAEQLIKHATLLSRTQPRKQQERRAARRALDGEIINAVGRLMQARKLNPKGRELDRKRLGRENFQVLKAAVDRKASDLVGRPLGERAEWDRSEIDQVRKALAAIIDQVASEIIDHGEA